jgi:hypothetical protein
MSCRPGSATSTTTWKPLIGPEIKPKKKQLQKGLNLQRSNAPNGRPKWAFTTAPDSPTRANGRPSAQGGQQMFVFSILFLVIKCDQRIMYRSMYSCFATLSEGSSEFFSFKM